MPAVLMVYISQKALPNLDWGLSQGRWAFPAGVASPDVRSIAVGDLVFFGVGGRPRGGGHLAGWRSRSLTEAHIARVVSLPYQQQVPFWLDEVMEGVVKYNPTIDIEYVKPLGPLPLSPRLALSTEASDALYRAGVSHQAKRISANGSPVLSGVRFRRRAKTSITRPAGSETATPDARLVAPETRRSQNALVKAMVSRTMKQTESALVHEYVDHLRAAGDEIRALLVSLPSGRRIRNDVINGTRRALVEAKGASTREHIRMAIGQILDYQRFCQRFLWTPKYRAVLLPHQPDPDMSQLLDSAGINAIWREGNGGFEDNAGGALV